MGSNVATLCRMSTSVNVQPRSLCTLRGCGAYFKPDDHGFYICHSTCTCEFRPYHPKVCLLCRLKVSKFLHQGYISRRESEYLALCWHWRNVIQLASKHGRVASWEDPTLGLMVYISCPTSPTLPSTRALFWNISGDSQEQLFSGFPLTQLLSSSLFDHCNGKSCGPPAGQRLCLPQLTRLLATNLTALWCQLLSCQCLQVVLTFWTSLVFQIMILLFKLLLFPGGFAETAQPLYGLDWPSSAHVSSS